MEQVISYRILLWEMFAVASVWFLSISFFLLFPDNDFVSAKKVSSAKSIFFEILK